MNISRVISPVFERPLPLAAASRTAGPEAGPAALARNPRPLPEPSLPVEFAEAFVGKRLVQAKVYRGMTTDRTGLQDVRGTALVSDKGYATYLDAWQAALHFTNVQTKTGNKPPVGIALLANEGHDAFALMWLDNNFDAQTYGLKSLPPHYRTHTDAVVGVITARGRTLWDVGSASGRW
ncbi:MAG: hypothetical protein ABI200_02630 [Gaiellales bacterium]